MSIFGVNKGRGPVPPAPNANNQRQVNIPAPNSVFQSATWGTNYAGQGERVALNIKLKRPPVRTTAKAEFFVNIPGAFPQSFDVPITFAISGLNATGYWITKMPLNKSAYITFRVWVDNQSVDSDQLRIANDPVAQAMKRINSDGFDRRD